MAKLLHPGITAAVIGVGLQLALCPTSSLGVQLKVKLQSCAGKKTTASSPRQRSVSSFFKWTLSSRDLGILIPYDRVLTMEDIDSFTEVFRTLSWQVWWAGEDPDSRSEAIEALNRLYSNLAFVIQVHEEKLLFGGDDDGERKIERVRQLRDDVDSQLMELRKEWPIDDSTEIPTVLFKRFLEEARTRRTINGSGQHRMITRRDPNTGQVVQERLVLND